MRPVMDRCCPTHRLTLRREQTREMTTPSCSHDFLRREQVLEGVQRLYGRPPSITSKVQLAALVAPRARKASLGAEVIQTFDSPRLPLGAA